jgi:hypothetical protein
MEEKNLNFMTLWKPFLYQSSGYDSYRHHAVLCIVVAMMSIYVMYVSNYSVVDMMPFGNANLYVVLARCLVISECDRKLLTA